MPILRFQASSPRLAPRRSARPLAAACLLALSLPFAAFQAHAQFTGDNGSDLMSQQSTEFSSINSNGNQGATQGGTQGQNADSTTRLGQPPAGDRARSGQSEPRDANLSRNPPYQPSEFERYVQRRADELQAQGRNAESEAADMADAEARDPNRRNGSAAPRKLVRRFGANLVTDAYRESITQDPLPAVPADYIVRPGDEIQLTIWGTVDADLRLTVDRGGNIAVPRVGSIRVAGLPNSELADAISQRVGRTFRNFQLSASLGQVRPVRVFVGGYAQRPGSLTVGGMSSVLHALMRAGGPSAAGSFRDIHLRRAGREIAVFDLYDLLLKGDRNSDQLVQPDDVIFIGPVGTQVAVLGSVNQQAIYELKPGETLDDALRMAGGFNAVADRSRVAIERLADRTTGRVTELALPAHGTDALATGDLVHVFSVVVATLPHQLQNQHVRIEGEVAHPGDYILPPGSHVGDALRAAGGMTAAAYPFGTEFTRESVRKAQQINYERALRDLETDMSKNQASQRATSAEELTAQSAAAAANARLLDRLRQVRPTGRVVLQLPPAATTLPDLALEDGDTLNIPNRGSSVGVFGSVFNTGSFLFEPGHTTADYLAQAGGPTRGADKDSIFMLRANGSVISARQGSSFWHSGSDFSEARVEAGDTIFVPEQINKSTFVQDAKDWTQILYQFGLGLAGIKSLGL
jgi:protein involved in polysaccharide export with SLBB domain